jgi:hypothetical protein
MAMLKVRTSILKKYMGKNLLLVPESVTSAIKKFFKGSIVEQVDSVKLF